MKITIIASGSINDIEFHKKLIDGKVICADGGVNNAKKMGIVPDYVIGDMDSAKGLDTLDKKTEVIVDKDQNKTDTQLAICLAESMNPDEITLIGAIGSRMDHTIANILTITSTKTKIKIIDEHNEIFICNGFSKIRGNIGDIISIIPIGDVKGITYDGLKWTLKNEDKNADWFGTSNELSKNEATISLEKGKLMIIKARD